MAKGIKNYISMSFGKDSLAAAIVCKENGIPVDGAVYCRIMFDDKISAELPEHEEWIHRCAIPKLERDFGIKTTVVQSQGTYNSYFYRIYGEKSAKQGQIYGFPFMKGPWCNSRLKIRPIEIWAKSVGKHRQIVGIAADEHKRIKKTTLSGKILPLVEHGITESQAFEICADANLLSPAYNENRRRIGCWFCHNQGIGELRNLKRQHPYLWKKLMQLDEDSPVTFQPGKTLRDYDRRFHLCEKD